MKIEFLFRNIKVVFCLMIINQLLRRLFWKI